MLPLGLPLGELLLALGLELRLARATRRHDAGVEPLVEGAHLRLDRQAPLLDGEGQRRWRARPRRGLLRLQPLLVREAGVDEDTSEEEGREDVLRACARYARFALTAFGYEEAEEGTASESSEGESEADDHAVGNGDECDDGAAHPPPPPPSPVRRDLVSARTRGALARLGGVAR